MRTVSVKWDSIFIKQKSRGLRWEAVTASPARTQRVTRWPALACCRHVSPSGHSWAGPCPCSVPSPCAFPLRGQAQSTPGGSPLRGHTRAISPAPEIKGRREIGWLGWGARAQPPHAQREPDLERWSSQTGCQPQEQSVLGKPQAWRLSLRGNPLCPGSRHPNRGWP